MNFELPLEFCTKQYPKEFVELNIKLKNQEHLLLLEKVEEVFQTQKEVILRLAPRDTEVWVVYFKIKEGGGNRMIVAHPDAGEWVATVALNKVVYGELIKKINEKNSVNVHELFRFTAPSNFYLSLEFV